MIPTHITIDIPQEFGGNKVQAIKAIRALTAMGLKEAKDLSEVPGKHRIQVFANQGHNYDLGRECTREENYAYYIKSMQGCGIRVYERVESAELIEDLKKLICNAVLRGESEMAQSLLSVLKEYQ